MLPEMSPRLLENGFQHFCQKLNFYDGFMGNRLGQNVRNGCGIISGFHKNSDFDMRFAGQSQCSHESHDCHSLSLNFLFFGGHICEAFIFSEYRI